jgi:2-polyprenyl-6-methoxyphenol hydroxylase-like FAD-dependent oxidoreductase
MYEAIVVGAGRNGLAAAVHLAAEGWKVAVVERADVAGGAVKTREVTPPGFRRDLFARQRHGHSIKALTVICRSSSIVRIQMSKIILSSRWMTRR